MKHRIKHCPFLLAAWIAKYGEYENLGKDQDYCYCAGDCALYDENGQKCSLLKKSRKGWRRIFPKL